MTRVPFQLFNISSYIRRQPCHKFKQVTTTVAFVATPHKVLPSIVSPSSRSPIYHPISTGLKCSLKRRSHIPSRMSAERKVPAAERCACSDIEQNFTRGQKIICWHICMQQKICSCVHIGAESWRADSLLYAQTKTRKLLQKQQTDKGKGRSRKHHFMKLFEPK